MKMIWRSSFILAVLALPVALSAQTDAEPKTIEKRLPFPSPVQWKLSDISVTLIGLAWGPANSPQMKPKGQETFPRDKPQFFSDRRFVLVLGFEARKPTLVNDGIYARSGLVRMKNIDGDMEAPWALTAAGLVPRPFDIHISRANAAQFWDFFPASADDKEFLFEVELQNNRILAFKIVVKDNGFVVTTVSPGGQSECSQFDKRFAGSIGPDSGVSVRLTRENATLYGSEHYTKIGKKLWLTGSIDSLDNFVLEESFPKGRPTGMFRGTFHSGCRVMSGYFSKPDGSRLQPFELREVP